MENVEVKQEIKNSDDGKGILITNDAIEQISNLLKGQSDKKVLRVGVRSGGCSGMSYTMDFIGTNEINPDDKVYGYSLFIKLQKSFHNRKFERHWDLQN